MFVQTLPLAAPIFSAAKTILTTVYGDIKSIFTLLCIVALVICLIGMLVSKNSKMVEEFRSWRNRIVWSWVLFNVLGSIASYGDTIFSGYQYS